MHAPIADAAETMSLDSQLIMIRYPSIRSLLTLTDQYHDEALDHGIETIGIQRRFPRDQYPLKTYIALIRLVAAALYPDVAEDEALFETGRRDLRSYATFTLVGRAAARMTSIMGPRRVLLALPRFLQEASTIRAPKVTEVNPQYFEITVPHVFIPEHYIRGTFYELTVLAGATNPVAYVSAPDADTRIYTICW